MAKSSYVHAHEKIASPMIRIGNGYTLTLVKTSYDMGVEVSNGDDEHPSMSLNAEQAAQVLEFLQKYVVLGQVVTTPARWK